LREEAKSGLVDWWADRIDAALMNQLAGNNRQTDLKFTGMNAVTLPTSWISSRYVNNQQLVDVAGDTLEARENAVHLNSGATFKLSDLTRARILAETRQLPIRPITIGSQKVYVCFIHPYQAQTLKLDTAAGQWLDIQKAAMQGGKISDNPIFTGALGMYDNVVLHVDARVPWGHASSGGRSDTALNPTSGNLSRAAVARAVFCGAQAGMLAFGRDSGWPFRMKWTEELRDYENQLGVSAAMIFGMKKTTFKDEANANGIDFGTITISSHAPAA
jgi:N4-gp56 family major capsid protein